MRPAYRAALAAAVGVLFAATYVIGGKVAPGIVGGVLAAILLYVAIGRFEAQHAANRARRGNGSGPHGADGPRGGDGGEREPHA